MMNEKNRYTFWDPQVAKYIPESKHHLILDAYMWDEDDGTTTYNVRLKDAAFAARWTPDKFKLDGRMSLKRITVRTVDELRYQISGIRAA